MEDGRQGDPRGCVGHKGHWGWAGRVTAGNPGNNQVDGGHPWERRDPEDSQGPGRPQGSRGTAEGGQGDPRGPWGQLRGWTLTEAEVLAGNVAEVLRVQEPVPGATQELPTPVAQVDQDTVGQHVWVPRPPMPMSHPDVWVPSWIPGSTLMPRSPPTCLGPLPPDTWVPPGHLGPPWTPGSTLDTGPLTCRRCRAGQGHGHGGSGTQAAAGSRGRARVGGPEGHRRQQKVPGEPRGGQGGTGTGPVTAPASAQRWDGARPARW